MKNCKEEQIKNVFLNVKNALSKGLWLSGYENEGTYMEWFEDGNTIYSIINFKNGRYDGEYKKYNRDGTIWDHSWYYRDTEVADFLKNPELKKEYGL